MIDGNVVIVNNQPDNKLYKKSYKNISNNEIKLADHSIPILETLFHGSKQLVNEFKLNIFQKRPIVYKDNNLSHLMLLLYDLNIKDMLSNTASDNIHVWLSNKESESHLIDSISIENVDHALKLYNSGHSLYCRASNELEHLVIPRILDELNLGISSSNNDRYRRGEIETFFSRSGHITTYHTDFQENITIQLSGRKKWTFKSSTFIHPLRGFTPHYVTNNESLDVIETQLKITSLIDPSFLSKLGSKIDNKIDDKIDSKIDDKIDGKIDDENIDKIDIVNENKKSKKVINKRNTRKGKKNITEIDSNIDNKIVPEIDNKVDNKIETKIDNLVYEVILEPGDVLYHPAGIWHQVECIDNESISINISLISTNYVDILSNCISQILLRNPIYRQAIKINKTNYSLNYESLNIIDSMIKDLPIVLKQISSMDILAMPTFISNTIDNKMNINDDKEINNDIESINDESIDNNIIEKVIDINEIDILTYYKNNIIHQLIYLNISDTSFDNISFHINPLAICISSKSIDSYINYNNSLNNSENSLIDKYIIHIGFGNDTYESMYRSILLISSEYKSYMIDFLYLYDLYHNNQRINNQIGNKIKTIESHIFTISSFSDEYYCIESNKSSNKRKYSSIEKSNIVNDKNSNIIRFLFGLHQCGLITLHNQT